MHNCNIMLHHLFKKNPDWRYWYDQGDGIVPDENSDGLFWQAGFLATNSLFSKSKIVFESIL